MQYTIALGLFIPLIGFFFLACSSSWISRRLTNLIGCGTIFISFLCFLSLLYIYTHDALNPVTFTFYNWMPIPELKADFALRLDPLSLVMTMIITGVGFLIHVYSIGYMEHDEDLARYFACMNFFVFSMLLLVLGANLLLLFVGWEGVGLASYLLIGYYYTRPAAAQAATKAFVINRIGDFGFLIGLLLTFYLFGTSDIDTVSSQAVQKFAIGAPIITVLTLLYFVGATGKSAQIPLQTWLPDAMEGPTPVSALIHAATMVTAGVYLVVRMHEVFMLAPWTMHLIAGVGAVTSLYAALCAVGQTDLKRVLAYSTISQLGLMFLACGIGAFYAAMFHLTTHAFMKSLLFLSAGNVVHMMSGTTDMGKMGGLAKNFPYTHWLFLIGVLAMSGIPPLAAFFSKDLILEQDYLAGFNTLFYIALVASILTAFYLTRAYCLTFIGAPHLDNKILKAIKEAPRIMLMPVSILGLLSICGGFLGFAFGRIPLLEGFLGEVGVTLAEPDGLLFTPETLLSIGGGLLGVGAGALMYTRYVNRLGPNLGVLKNSFYINEIYWAVFGWPLEKLSKFIDYFVEPKIFEGSIGVLVQSTQKVAHWLQEFQSGQIRSYVAWMVVGTVLLIAYFVF
jgi:NADH-quinone oxidoreductase subunit L